MTVHRGGWQTGQRRQGVLMRRCAALGAALSLVFAMLGVVTPRTAAAAPGPNPYVTVSVTKAYDGTGFGNGTATFVNTANGFSPGDDNDHDGVVSSNDTVGYTVTFAIQAGLKRTVVLDFQATEFLQFGDLDLAAFCASGPGVTARVQNGTCVLDIAQGAQGAFSQRAVFTALDTGGVAEPNQSVTVSVGVQGKSAYTSATSPAVTVVSAPAADLMLLPQGSKPGQCKSNVVDYGTTSGSFTLAVYPLGREGYSPVKGASTAGEWQAVVDVSAFPANTVWTFGGKTVTASSGKLTLTGTGTGTLGYSLPSGWAAQEEGSTRQYGISMVVASDSFAAPGGLLNNGTGWQPGDGQGQGETTKDASLGSLAGCPFPNDDYSAVEVNRPLPTQGVIFTKQVTVPRTSGEGLFEPGNMAWDEAASTGHSYSDNPAKLAQGSQFTQVLQVNTAEIETPQRIAVADVWDPSLQRVDPSLPITVTDPDGNPVSPAGYTQQWSSSVTDASASAASNAGWVTGANPPANARAVRVVFAEGALPVADADGAGWYSLTVPALVKTGLVQGTDGPVARDLLHGRLGTGEDGSVEGAVQIVWPTDPQAAISHVVTNVQDPDGKDRPGFDAGDPTAVAGDTVTFKVTPQVVNPPAPSQGFTPQVRVVLDRCVSGPVNLSGQWTMTVEPGTPSVPGGPLCGDPDATPTVLVFTPKKSPVMADVFNDTTQTATLPEITYSVHGSRGSTGVREDNAILTVTGVGLNAVVDENGDPAPVADEASYRETSSNAVGAVVSSDPGRQDVDEKLSWVVETAATLGEPPASSMVIALPRNNDGDAYWSTVQNPDLYPDAHGSSFGGTYQVSSISLDKEDSTAGVTLWYTTCANPPVADPLSDSCPWYPVDQAGQNGNPPLAGATGVRIDQPNGYAAATVHIDVQPSGNAPDDVYVLWPSAIVENTPGGQPVNGNTPAWPAQVEIVAGTISGTVWWDENDDSILTAGEPGINGVTVGLFAVAEDGTVAATPVATCVTGDTCGGNTPGFYEFTDLHSGNYVTRIVTPGAELANYATHYNPSQAVEETYSYRDRTFALAGLTSTQLGLPVGGAVTQVDYGFFKPNPLADVDKRVQGVSCTATTCEVQYVVTITNHGNTPITDGTFTDTLSDSVYNVTAQAGNFPAPVVQVVNRFTYNGGYASTADGKVYAWGYGYSALGDGTTSTA
ncbi:SdrD B-like domain-containing protein, partial [Propionicicella superfundia]|uniref:SdrD B-like domain-containing protein n=1 Tax=Propionicicella superfundia TaxID=348582 RepID=UPI000491DFF8